MTSVPIGLPTLLLLAGALACAADVTPRVLSARAFGAIGDGVTDDGPAIGRLLAAAAAVHGPVRLQFAAGKTYSVRTAASRYVFPLAGMSDLTLDGGGSTFILDPYLRFLSLRDCTRVLVRGLNVDFSPLPFVDATVIGVDAAGRRLQVRVAEGRRIPVGEPTGEDGEQAFFSMLWHEGPYGPLSRHYWTERIEPGDAADRAWVYATEGCDGFEQVLAGEWRISLPVPGSAHRYGPGPCFAMVDNDTVTMEDVELWSAPWFGFEVARNRGSVTFRRVSIRAKPESGRLMSVWRDGFHVKGNSASLLWEDCVLAGMNDDAFNVSTHCSELQRVLAPTQIEVRQRFPLLPIPWHAGATLTAADEPAGRLLGTARILSAEPGPEPEPIQGQPAAPMWTLTLEAPIPGLGEGTMLWDAARCNPDTTLRRCRIEMSCRMQSPVRLEACDVRALLWFYCEHVEGGFPHHVRLERCVLRRGRGNPAHAVVFSGGPSGHAASPQAGAVPRAIHDIVLSGNEVWGGLVVEGTEGARLTGNRLLESGAPLVLSGNHGLVWEGNTGPDGEMVSR